MREGKDEEESIASVDSPKRRPTAGALVIELLARVARAARDRDSHTHTAAE